MAERPEDLTFPPAAIQKILKESLPASSNVTSEARQTICRASSVFVLYLTACAASHASKAKRKMLATVDVLAALNDMDFETFAPALRDSIRIRKELLASAHAAPTGTDEDAPRKRKNTEPAANGDDDVVEIDQDEDDDAGDGKA